MPDAIQLVSQHLNLSAHVLVVLLQGHDEVDRFAENLPFARLHSPVRRQLVAQLVKEILHLFPSLSLRQLVRYPQLRGARVGGGS